MESDAEYDLQPDDSSDEKGSEGFQEFLDESGISL